MSEQTLYIIIMAAVTFAVTVGLRAFPFLLFGGGKKCPAVITYIGKVLSPAAIAMLVIYSFYGSLEYSLEGFSRFLPAAAASILTVILQYFFKNPLVSIIAGTALFMYLIR